MTALPPEISLLHKLCVDGDIDVPDIENQFLSNLKAFADARDSLWKRCKLQRLLASAILHARPGIVKLLLSHGVEVFEVSIKAAVETRSKQLFQLLIDGGWDVNRPLGPFDPPVLACFVDDPDFTQWFLNRGADPNARCFLDLTPMSIAVKDAQLKNIENLLYRRGVSITKGQLVYHAVERSKNAVEVLQMLVSRGAPLDNIKYSDHMRSWEHEHFRGLGSPLHRAVELQKVDVVDFLLREGADPTREDTKRRTPLAIAKHVEDATLVDLITCATREWVDQKDPRGEARKG